MEKVIFKPAPFSPSRVVVFTSLMLVSVMIGLVVLPRVHALYAELPNADTYYVLLMSYVAIIAPWIIGIIAFLAIQNKSITVDKKFLYFSHKPWIGNGESKIINLENVVLISHRTQTFVIPTGKSVVPIVRIWLIFRHTDNHTEEIIVNDWDPGTLKQIMYYIKGRFPKIKFDTHVYRDSSEVLSGLQEYLDK